MAETRTTARPARKAPAARKRAAPRKPAAADKAATRAARIDRTTELSDDVFKSLESAQRAAIEAVRKFVDVVDEAVPAIGERPSRRQEVVDAAMEMADRLVHTQYDFLRKVVHSAGEALTERKQ